MEEIWKKTSLNLVMENTDKYDGFKSFKMNNIIKDPETTQVLMAGTALSSLMEDSLVNVELTKTTIINAE